MCVYVYIYVRVSCFQELVSLAAGISNMSSRTYSTDARGCLSFQKRASNKEALQSVLTKGPDQPTVLAATPKIVSTIRSRA